MNKVGRFFNDFPEKYDDTIDNYKKTSCQIDHGSGGKNLVKILGTRK